MFVRGFRRSALVCLLACTPLATAVMTASPAQAQAALMPKPQSMSLSNGVQPIGAGIRVVWDTRPSPLMLRAVARFEERLAAVAGPAKGGAPYILHLTAGSDPAYLSVSEKEHYTLTTTATGARLDADGPAGVIHGLATVLQLVEQTPQGAVIGRVHIDDAPRFAWRGLLLDVSRHFASVETVERQLDAMELVKLNVLHWHLSDGTGFRVESRLFPKLQTVGSHGQFYTQAQIRTVLAYAADRGIRVVPEFDVPGHALAIAQAYPELAAQPLPDPGKPGLNLNNAALDPTKPETLRFVHLLFGEMGGLFPDRYVHTGGDEVAGSQWTSNPAIAAYMKAHGMETPDALQSAFTVEVARIIAAQGKVMMGWDEIIEEPGSAGKIPADVVVQPWRASKWIGSATQSGHPVVVSAGYYLDLLRPSAQHYAVDPFDTRAEGLSEYAIKRYPPKKPAFLAPFVLDAAAPPLDAAQKARVMGAEATLWTEMVSEPMFDARLWPRMAALAERFWSPQNVRDEADMERRLPLVMTELQATGLRAAQNRDAMREAMLSASHGAAASVAPLDVLTDVTVPVRNYALNHLAAASGDAMLAAPVAVAGPDSFAAMHFNDMAARYVEGDPALAAPLRQMLEVWAGNDDAFAALAKDRPALAEVLPVSQAVARLARAGLNALDHRSGTAWRMDATTLLHAQDQFFANSADMLAARHAPQPPGGLLIAILPGLHALLDASQ